MTKLVFLISATNNLGLTNNYTLGHINFKELVKTLFIILIWILVSFPLFSETNRNQLRWIGLEDIPPSPGEDIQYGIASPFAGISNGVLIVGGGCNFPNKPVSDGGEKVYYKSLFVLKEPKDEKWLTGFSLPEPVAYGASVSTDFGLVCIGGKNNDQDFKEVYLLSWEVDHEKIEITPWPSLPFSMSEMAADKIGDIIYVAGGKSNKKVENNFLSLNLSNYGTDKFKWETLPSFPGPGRVQPVGIGQNAAEEGHFYLFSGSSYPEKSEEPILCANGLEYNPKTQTWIELPEIKPGKNKIYSLHGAGGAAIGAHQIMFIGGVNRELFYEAWKRERTLKIARSHKNDALLDSLITEVKNYFLQPPEWYKFNDKIILYHTITKSFSILGDYPYQAPAGAPVVQWKNGFVVVSGEIKPGVRSPKVHFATIDVEAKFGAINWSLLVIYLIGMLYLGYFFMKRGQNTNDFFKGGERIPWWAAGMSIFATMLSAITFMAIPAKTYATDWKYIPLAITIFIVAFPVVKYFLPFFRRLNVTTAYEYLELRFNYATRIVASILFIVFMISRTALVLFLPSLALTTITGIDIYLCIVLMGIITILYCTMGGVEAVIWGDVIQGFILLAGALLAVYFLISGIEGGMGRMLEISISDKKFKFVDMALSLKSATLWVVVLGGLANNLISYTSDQTVIQRYLTTKNETAAGKSIILNGVLSILVSFIFYFIGTALYVYYKTHPSDMSIALNNPDSIFPHFIMTKMPIGIAGIMIASIFAATMSTISSNINSLSTAFTVDIFQHFFKGLNDKKKLKVARISGIVLGSLGVIIALIMAGMNILSLFDFFNFILGLLASGIGGLFILGIFFGKVKGKAAFLGFGTGIIALFIISYQTDISFLLYGFIGLVSTVIFALIWTWILPAEPIDVQNGLTFKTIKSKQ